MEPLYRERMVAAVPQDHVLAKRDALRWSDFHREKIFVQEWTQSHAMREFYASMMGIGLPLESIPAGKQTVFGLVAAGFGVTLAQQSQAEVSFPGVVFKPVDETNAKVEFCLAWSPDPSAPSSAAFSRRCGQARSSAIRAFQPSSNKREEQHVYV
jgi:DNA-binding transcriptional LysR family regulator